MKLFPQVHLWLLLPLIIAVCGFYFSYWSKFSQVPYHQHLHGLTATLWYLVLVIQPWLYKSKNMQLHRKIGFIALFLAGGVVFSALQVIPGNLSNERLQPILRYGLTWADFIFLAGFTHAVIMAMLNSRQIAIHARYLIASAFWALLPALSRLIYYPLVAVFGYPASLNFIQVLYLSGALMLSIIGMVMDYRKQKKVYNSYVFVVGGTLLFMFSFEFMGQAQWWIEFCDALLG